MGARSTRRQRNVIRCLPRQRGWLQVGEGLAFWTMPIAAGNGARTISCRDRHCPFLLHVLPDGFQRIRYFGFLANRYRAEKLALCRQLMQMPPPTTREVHKDYRDRYEALTGVSLKTCPLCRCGTMVVVETAPFMDTS
jgi:Putative transposase